MGVPHGSTRASPGRSTWGYSFVSVLCSCSLRYLFSSCLPSSHVPARAGLCSAGSRFGDPYPVAEDADPMGTPVPSAAHQPPPTYSDLHLSARGLGRGSGLAPGSSAWSLTSDDSIGGRSSSRAGRGRAVTRTPSPSSVCHCASPDRVSVVLCVAILL